MPVARKRFTFPEVGIVVGYLNLQANPADQVYVGATAETASGAIAGTPRLRRIWALNQRDRGEYLTRAGLVRSDHLVIWPESRFCAC